MTDNASTARRRATRPGAARGGAVRAAKSRAAAQQAAEGEAAAEQAAEGEAAAQQAAERGAAASQMAALGLGVGIAVEILFYGHPLGISVLLWAALCTAALLLAARLYGVRPARSSAWLAAPILFFAVMPFLRLEGLSALLSLAAVVGLLLLWVRTFRTGDLPGFGWTDFALAWLMVSLEGWAAPWATLGAAQRRLLGDRQGRGQAMAIVRGLLLAFPILVLLIALLSGADIVFADRVQQALRWFDLERIVDWIGRGTLIALSGLFSLGCLVLAVRPPDYRRRAGTVEPLVQPFLGFPEAVIVLAGVNLVFALFVGIQFTYLFGGQGNIHAAGYTYAEYARRGFGELVAVAVISLGLILALGTWARRKSRPQRGWFNGLSALLVGQMGVVLASALLRLLLYEGAYGFTRLRTYTHLAIFWMAGLFAAFLVLLLLHRLDRFALVAAAAALGFTASLNLMNVDAFIVQRNIGRLEQGGELDLTYLLQLTEDAVPALAELARSGPVEVRQALAPELACWLAQAGQRDDSWPSTHRSRLRARVALLGLADQLEGHAVWWERQGWMVQVDGHPQRCLRQPALP
jgi:hypothetical protein